MPHAINYYYAPRMRPVSSSISMARVSSTTSCSAEMLASRCDRACRASRTCTGTRAAAAAAAGGGSAGGGGVAAAAAGGGAGGGGVAGRMRLRGHEKAMKGEGVRQGKGFHLGAQQGPGEHWAAQAK